MTDLVGLLPAVLLLFFTQLGWADPLDTWTESHPLPQNSNMQNISYGNGLFVAVGFDGTSIASVDAVDGETGITNRELSVIAI